MCNPIKTFEAIISEDQTISINRYISPTEDRSLILSEDMPKDILYSHEINILQNSGYDINTISSINEEMRSQLCLRNTDHPINVETAHVRSSMR